MLQNTVLLNFRTIQNSPPELLIETYSPAIVELQQENRRLNRDLAHFAQCHAPREQIIETIEQIQHNWSMILPWSVVVERARADLQAEVEPC